jgi:hypothetical protein
MISLTPNGHLVPAFETSTEPLPGLADAFRQGVGTALLALGAKLVAARETASRLLEAMVAELAGKGAG